MIVPCTHNVWPTSASVIVKTSRQPEFEVGVTEAGIWVDITTASIVAVLVGRVVGVFVIVWVGLSGVLVLGIGVTFTCWVLVGAARFKLTSLRSSIERPGPISKNTYQTKYHDPDNNSND